jgi:hypothetical protein
MNETRYLVTMVTGTWPERDVYTLAVFDNEGAAQRYAAAVSLDIATAGFAPGHSSWYGACRVDMSTRVFVEHIAANPEFLARAVLP